MSQNPIELTNVRVLSTTYEKLLISISSEQAEILSAISGIEVKSKESETYGTSYTVVVKCSKDNMCNLYNTIKRKDIIKSCYNIVVVVNNWTWLNDSGVRLDAYFTKKLEPILTVNPTLKKMISPALEVEEVRIKVKVPKRVINSVV